MSNKPTCYYKFRVSKSVGIGLTCRLFVENHPHLGDIPYGRRIYTSNVVDFDPATGRIETLNTIYLPENEFN